MTDRGEMRTAAIPIRCDPGGEASVLGLDGDRLSLRAPSAVAPGTRLRAALGDGCELRLKVLHCVRQGAQFAIEARLIDASRELRRALTARLAPSQPAGRDGEPAPPR